VPDPQRFKALQGQAFFIRRVLDFGFWIGFE
jgi:hypothetical protein